MKIRLSPASPLLIAICCGLVTAAFPARALAETELAGPQEKKIELREAYTLLQRQRYEVLDARMNLFQKAYRDGAEDDVALLRQFNDFAFTEPDMAANFDGWIKAFPNSYAAHLARGIYYFKSGVQTRGKKYISRTTNAQVQGMTAYLDRAQQDFQDSLALDSKPILSYRFLIGIATEYGKKDADRQLLDAALKLDPKAITVRRRYMMSLETRWGGSLDQMLAFQEESRKAGIADEQMQSLQAMIDKERKWLARQLSQGEQVSSD